MIAPAGAGGSECTGRRRGCGRQRRQGRAGAPGCRRPRRVHRHAALLAPRAGGQLMLAAPAGGDTRSNRVGGGEGLLAQPQLRHHAHRAHQPGAVHLLEGAQPPRFALAALRAGLPGLRRRAAGHGRPHAPRAARRRLLAFAGQRHVPPGLRSLGQQPGRHHLPDAHWRPVQPGLHLHRLHLPYRRCGLGR